MISDKQLQDHLNGVWLDDCDLDTGEMAQELLAARQKIDKWENAVQKREEYVNKLEWQINLLKEDAERLAECLRLHTDPFEMPWESDYEALEKHADLMREIKVQGAIDKTLSENTEAWKKLADE